MQARHELRGRPVWFENREPVAEYSHHNRPLAQGAPDSGSRSRPLEDSTRRLLAREIADQHGHHHRWWWVLLPPRVPVEYMSYQIHSEAVSGKKGRVYLGEKL
jgi:hypothetical protein